MSSFEQQLKKYKKWLKDEPERNKETLAKIATYCQMGLDYFKMVDKGKYLKQYDDEFTQERVRIELESVYNDILEIIDPLKEEQ